MTGPKLNEYPARRPGIARPGVTAELPRSTRARARYVRVSPSKVRVVLDLIRGHDVERAAEILRFCERDAATVVGKVLGSAVANADHNDSVPADELYVSACYADEGPTLKRWRPRARGRATRIRKRTCHITLIVSRLSEAELARRRTRAGGAAGDRARRRAGQLAAAERSRQRNRRDASSTPELVEGAILDQPVVAEPVVDEPVADEPMVDEPLADEPVVAEPAVDEPVAEEPEPAVAEPVAEEPNPSAEAAAGPLTGPGAPAAAPKEEG